MDWGAVIQLTLAIVGAALVVSGIVAYRGSMTVAVRPFAAAAVAAGAVMWVVVLITVPVSITGKPPGPTVEKVETSAQLGQ